MKKVIFTIFVMVFSLASCVVGAFAYSENTNPGVYVVSPNGGYSLTTPSSTKLSTSAMQQFALDLYTPEFADSFVLWRTDSSHVGTRYVRGVDFVLYNSRYVIRVYDGSSYGYVGYIVGNECRLYWSNLSPYDTDSLLSNISSEISTISDTLTALSNSLSSWIGGQLNGIYYWTNQINVSADQIMQRTMSIDNSLSSFFDGHTVSDIISAIPAAPDLSNIESTLSSINNKLDNLPSSSGSAYDDSALLAALQPITSFYEGGVETVAKQSNSGLLNCNLQFERGTFSLLSLDAPADADVFFLAENAYYSPISLSFASPVRSSSSPTLSALGPTLAADADHITVTVKKTLDLPISVGTYDIQFFDTSGDAIALKTGDCFLPGSDVGVWQIQRAEGGYITIGSTTGLPNGFEFSDLFYSCVRFKASELNSAPALFSYWLDYFYNTETYYSLFRIVSSADSTITFRYSTLHPVLAWLAQRQNGFQTWLGNKLDNLPGSSPSDLSNIESALSTIIDKMDNLPASVDNIVVNITEDNSAYNIFYVEDENGDKKSVTSVAGDSLSASGKLLQFLYKLIIGSAISDVDNSIGGLNDFFFDNAPSGLGEGVTVWD